MFIVIVKEPFYFAKWNESKRYQRLQGRNL